MKLLIRNKVNFHYEIIESVLLNYHSFFDFDKDKHKVEIEIYLDIYHNDCFKKYLSEKYPYIQFKNTKEYDYSIDCTIYDRHFSLIDKTKSKNKYIAHEITQRLQGNPNVFFLTPLAGKNNFIDCDILPFIDQKKNKTDRPVYIIQGNLNDGRRDLNLLKEILNEPTNDHQYPYPFVIKMIGRGILPPELNEYKDRIVLKNNLDFVDYHKEFLDGYCILPLISRKTHPHYYSTKLTSTVNYAKGYKLKCLLDEDLQKIYGLENKQVYKDINDIKDAFRQTLCDFYQKE
jgi:hypothetical protein